MIKIKQTKREIENTIYINTLYVNATEVEGEEITDFYVTLDNGDFEEIIYLEPYTIEEALKNFADIEEYLASKSKAYDELMAKLK